MIGDIRFPEGVSWEINNKNLYDIYGEEYYPTSVSYAYQYSKSEFIRIKFNTCEVTDMSYMFIGCEKLRKAPQFDTSNATNMRRMFAECDLIESVDLHTDNVTDMNGLFYYCIGLTNAPSLNTGNVTDMGYMFYSCSALESVPMYDMRNVTAVNNMFSNCSKLLEIPDCNLLNIKNFGGGSYNSWLYGVTKLKKIGVIDCDSVTDIGYVLGNGNRNDLTELGGFRNLGKSSSVSNTNSNYFMNYAPNLTYESVMNVLNLLYDRAANGLSNLTLKLHANHMALLSEEDKLVAINKGWTLTS